MFQKSGDTILTGEPCLTNINLGVEMSSAQAPAFRGVVETFGDTLVANFKQPVPAQPEDQLKTPVGELLRATGQLSGLEVGWRTEVHHWDVDGRPDIGVVTNGLLTGHVELKAPGLGARPEGFKGQNRIQWERFKALPNLVYTDGSEWGLYRSGEPVLRVRIADDVCKDGIKGASSEALATLGKLLQDFLYWEPVVPATAEGLAGFLAPLSRVLRDEVKKGLEQQTSHLKSLANEWGGLLFPESDQDQFADAYAQTVTYALLLARFEGAESLRPLRAVDTLQREHALLAEALQLLEANAVRDELSMPIELLERAIGAVDPAKAGFEGDPWLYFYEQFLGAYDPKLRKNRGVYFTPVEVVRAQVRLVGELLRTRFGKQMAFADDDVVVLDPAVGTGTYPLAILDHAQEAVQKRLGPGAVMEKLQGLADRLYAFEILVGPYSVAHLRLTQRLKSAGITSKTPKVYLTDTLESPNQIPGFTASLLQANLTEERRKALEVKKDVRVLVCLGNPPYDREEQDQEEDQEQDQNQRKGGWVRYGEKGKATQKPILEDFLAPAREADAGVHLKNLYNDYVYFWRWALWKALDSTEDAGIITFITASSYLRGPGFVGMRQKMREVFDELWIIDLEGDNLGARKTENVFAIRTPVAIAIGVRHGSPDSATPAKVMKTRLTGSEEEKLAALENVASFDCFSWHLCSNEWGAPFFPEGTGTYFSWPQITDVFPWQYSGVQLKRKWPIAETEKVLSERWRALLGATPDQKRTLFRETEGRTILGEYPRLLEAGKAPALATLDTNEPVPEICSYAYRAFDRQHIIRDTRLGDRFRPVLHHAHSGKQIYLTSLLTNVLGSGPAAMASSAIPDLHHFCGRGAKDVIPLWRDKEATQPNVTGGLLQSISDKHSRPVAVEQLFSYAYGILAQPAYVERFWDELETPPPHLPITKDATLFQRVADYGARLLYLHTYGERFGTSEDDGSVPQGAARCTKGMSTEHYPEGFTYDSTEMVIKVGNGEFSPVSPEVWNYSVSGLQVVKSWLDHRKLKPAGHKSSPLDEIRPERWEFTEEFLNLLWVLEATIKLQPEGDALLNDVYASEIFLRDELPSPTKQERSPPDNAPAQGEQLELSSEEPS